MKTLPVASRSFLLLVLALVVVSAGIIVADTKKQPRERIVHYFLDMQEVQGATEKEVEQALKDTDAEYDYSQDGHHHHRHAGLFHRGDWPKTKGAKTNGHITQLANFQKVSDLKKFLSKAKIHDP